MEDLLSGSLGRLLLVVGEGLLSIVDLFYPIDERRERKERRRKRRAGEGAEEQEQARNRE